MIDVVVYKAKAMGYLEEADRIKDIPTLEFARQIFLDFWEVYLENPGWNIKKNNCSFTQVEGHIWGYGRDEHYFICIEDPGSTRNMDFYNQHLLAEEYGLKEY